MCRVVLARTPGGPRERITPGLVVQFGEPGLAQCLDDGVVHHRSLLSSLLASISYVLVKNKYIFEFRH